jgi:hypothetical protein
MKIDHPKVEHSQAEHPMLVVMEAVKILLLRCQGKRIREIAQMLDASRNSVRRYLRRNELPHCTREARPRMLDPFIQDIDQRVKAATRTGFLRQCLWELKAGLTLEETHDQQCTAITSPVLDLFRPLFINLPPP